MLEELIDYVAGHDDVWFAHHLDVAEEWKRMQVAGRQPGTSRGRGTGTRTP